MARALQTVVPRLASFLVIDPQLDFCEKLSDGRGGRLEVKNAHNIFPTVNRIAREWPRLRLFSRAKAGPRVASQDYHDEHHKSFFSEHEGVKPFDQGLLNGLPQTFWYPHCQQLTDGCLFHPDFEQQHFSMIIRKGMDTEVDSYSAFRDNGRKIRGRVVRGNSTGLAEFYTAMGVTDVYIAGITLPFCVEWSAIDSADAGFRTYVIVDSCSLLNVGPNTLEASIARMKAKGVKIITSDQLKVAA